MTGLKSVKPSATVNLQPMMNAQMQSRREPEMTVQIPVNGRIQPFLKKIAGQQVVDMISLSTKMVTRITLQNSLAG